MFIPVVDRSPTWSRSAGRGGPARGVCGAGFAGADDPEPVVSAGSGGCRAVGGAVWVRGGAGGERPLALWDGAAYVLRLV